MVENFYTNVIQWGNKIYVRGYRDGKRIKQAVDYKPYLFHLQEGGFYRTIHGQEVDKIEFASIRSAKDLLDTYAGVENAKIYGLSNFQYLYIYDNYPGEIQFDPLRIKVVSIDIECAADEGFPSTERADKEITAITLRIKGKSIAFGCGSFSSEDKNITYVKCENEVDLLSKFLNVWDKLDIDVVTGWNIEFFDIPYLVNRITNLIPGAEKYLSPWRVVRENSVKSMNQELQTYTLMGLSILDYYHLYRKFTFGNSESYKLDYIAQEELGERKLDYSEYGSLLELYKNNFQKFMEYNIHDAVLVERLEDKLNFIKQVFSLAYDAKVNYNDTLATVLPWDIIIHNYLLDRRIVVPPNTSKTKSRINIGGYVKDPKLGLSKWVVSFDLKSSYPHQCIQYNVSPDTFVKIKQIASIDDLIDKGISFEHEPYAVAANGSFFRKDKQGFLAALMEKMFNDRTIYSKKLAEVEAEYEKTKDPVLLNLISKYNNMQMAKKIQLNSAYGAIANEFFRWFDIDLAEAITVSGQLAVKFIAKRLNEYLNKLFETSDKDYVIASDTDSVYLDLENLATKWCLKAKTDAEIRQALDKFCKTILEPYIARCYDALGKQMNVYKQCMSMAREIIANKGIWTAKKRYILNVLDKKGIVYDKPKIKMTGIEAVRSSTPQVCRKKIKEALEVIMNKSEADLQEFIAQFKEHFYTMPFEDVAFPRGVKGLYEYHDSANIYRKATPIHVKGSLIYNMLLDQHQIQTTPPIRNGDKIKFAYLKVPNPLRQTVIASHDSLPNQFNLDKYIDKELQFEKAFLDPLRTITVVLNWNVEPIATLGGV